MKTIVAMMLVMVVAPAFAQDIFEKFNRGYERRQYDAERDLEFRKNMRDLGTVIEKRGGPSAVGDRMQHDRACQNALERGVEDGVRRSLGCRD